MSNTTDSSDESHLVEHLHSIETIGGFSLFFLIVIIFLIIFVYYKIKLMNEIKKPLMSVQNNHNMDLDPIDEEFGQDPEIK